MASKVQICNFALGALGHKAFIQSLTEDSVEARYASLFYDQARQETLRAHPWNFAKATETLALLNVGVTPWSYQYALPSTCLKARYIVTQDVNAKIDFEIALGADRQTKVLNTNQEYAVLAYTYDLENTSLFDSLFTTTMALKLASYIAEPITGNTQKTQAMLSRWINALHNAEAVDAGEGEREDTTAPDWLEARIGGATVTIEA